MSGALVAVPVLVVLVVMPSAFMSATAIVAVAALAVVSLSVPVVVVVSVPVAGVMALG